jgi:heavy metal translocating P-type ATPase
LSAKTVQSAASSNITSPRQPNLLREYPLAFLALTGIVCGAVLFPFHAASSRFCFALVAIGGGVPLSWTTLRQMTQGRFHVDTIAALAIWSSVALGEYVAGALVVLMQSGGQALEDYGLRRANRSLDHLLQRAPSVAHLKHGEEFVDIPAAEVGIGETLLVRPGDILAADGIVTAGWGNVDEAALTGEPIPLSKSPGDRVYSGTINLSGSFEIRTTQTAARSKYELIVAMVKQAAGERAPINRLANRYTPVFTALTLIVAAVTLLITREPLRSLSVLVVATPCPLIIATPLAVLSAINKAASMNIIVKSGAAIEESGRVDQVVFDKTGTLTSGIPTLSEIRLFEQASADFATEDFLLQAAAGVEMLSPHILAAAVVQAARERNLPLTAAVDVQESPGTGIRGTVFGKRMVIGSGGYAQSQGVTISEPYRAERQKLGAEGKTVAYIAADGKPAGFLIFEDRVRPEAAQTLERLRHMNLGSVTMLTGDAPETAHAVADKVGIQDVLAQMQPEDKLATVRRLSQSNVVMMVGDGINDAPALATAQVGVAMGNCGAGIATDAADIVITVENLERVADVIALGREMVTVAKQGILFGIGASLLLMVCASLGWIPPAVGALLQEALDLVTIFNALRVR